MKETKKVEWVGVRSCNGNRLRVVKSDDKKGLKVVAWEKGGQIAQIVVKDEAQMEKAHAALSELTAAYGKGTITLEELKEKKTKILPAEPRQKKVQAKPKASPPKKEATSRRRIDRQIDRTSTNR